MSIRRCQFLSISCATLIVLIQPLQAQLERKKGFTSGKTTGSKHETEQETIAKCLRDLASDDVKRRRRAVYVVGKYKTPEVVAALIKALGDPDDQVRQAALVSLSEEGQVTPQAFRPILNLIKDENVHIRRIASSLLQFIMPRLRLTLQKNPAAEVAPLFAAALEDPDAVVRKNVLSVAHFAIEWLPRSALVHNLEHADREVRLLALQAYVRSQKKTDFVIEDIAPLLNDENGTVRAEAVSALSHAGRDAVPLLVNLIKDKDLEVSIRAMERLLQLRNAHAIEHLQSFLFNEQLPADKRSRLLGYVLMLDEDNIRKVLKQVIDNGPISMKVQAIQMLSGVAAKKLPISYFLDLLELPSSDVRRVVNNVLTQRHSEIDLSDIEKLLRHPAVDVRLTALNLCRMRPGDEISEHVVEALLDENVEIRAKAIEIAAIKGIAEWPLFMQQSLQDPSHEIKQAAVRSLLLRKDQQSRDILMKYLDDAHQSEVAEERILAFSIIEGLKLQSEKTRKILESWLKDPNEILRKKAAQLLTQSSAQDVTLLRNLVTSDNSQVRIHAIRQLAQKRDPEVLPIIKQLVLDDALPLQERVLLVQYLHYFPDQVTGPLTALTKSEQPALQAAAIRSLARLNQNAPAVGFFLNFVDNSEEAVQHAAAYALLLQRNKLTSEQIQELFYKTNSVQFQRTAVQMINRLPQQDQQKMLQTAIKSEDVALKTIALRTAAIYSIPGWRQILIDALNDDNENIQKAAAGGLLIRARQDTSLREILREYQKRCPDPRYAQILKQRLDALK